MRWNVEVSSIDNSARGVGAGSVVIEAESWQRALQDARTQRGEDGSISGFSIELLEEGYRAVDPVARLRYTVKRAAEAQAAAPAPVVPVASGYPASPASGPAPRPAASSGPPFSSGAPSPPSGASASAPSSSNGHASVAPPASAVASNRPPDTGGELRASVAAPTSVPSSNARPSQAQLAYEGNVPAARLLSKREHDASERVPLTYREHVYCVAAGVTEHDAERFLRVELDRLKISILRSRPGKFVNMAVFDVAFQGRPPVAPLATLAWKDWRGAPVIDFPRRGSPPASPPAVAPSSPAAMVASIPAAPIVPSGAGFPPPVAPSPPPPSEFPPPVVSAPPPPVTTQLGAAWPPPAIPAPAASPSPLSPSLTSVDPFAADAPIPPEFSAPSESKASVSAPAHPEGLPSGFPPPALAPATSPAAASFPPPPVSPYQAPAPSQPASLRPVSRPASSRPSIRAGGPRRRASGDDLIADLFEAMHELHFCHDALEAGDFVLRLALDTIPSRFALAHLYDIDRREFVVAATLGAVDRTLLARREPESDPLLSAVMRGRRSLRLDATEDARARGLGRYESAGGAKSVLLSPVMKGGRYLGAIELVDPLDGVPYTASEGNALDYMSEQYAEFLALRGVVVDAERISRQPANPYP